MFFIFAKQMDNFYTGTSIILLMEHKDMLKKLSKPVTVQKVIKEDNSKETMVVIKTFI